MGKSLDLQGFFGWGVFSATPHGSPYWTRTSDTLINSQVLYRLSYGGIWGRKRTEVRERLTSVAGVGEYLFSRAVASQVSSARQSLTSVFGMGTGGPSASISPTLYRFYTGTLA